MYRVLIIDDEPWSREVVKALGEWDRLQINIIGEAEDGRQGLQFVSELQPHIVITDMRLPGIEGVELLKELSEKSPLLKIIVMSGYDDLKYLRQAIRSRALEYLLKPINPEELNLSLERCVRELEENANNNKLWRTPLVFEDSSALDNYIAFRQQILGYLMELNKAEVLRTFEKFAIFLESILPQSQMKNMLSKISHDFILVLEEFINKNEITFEQIWGVGFIEQTTATDWNSISVAIKDIEKFYEKAIDSIETLRKSKNRVDIIEVQKHIDRHFQETISLESIAQHFFISKEHLSRTFKSFAGENISDYIVRKKMEKAKELIVEQKLSIKNVAQLTGYDDIAYFYRVFKRHFGITPGEIR